MPNPITLKDLKDREDIRIHIQKADDCLKSIGYT